MREVIVTSGTRAAGKTTFCEKALALDPSLVLISRDKILVELFGKEWGSPYTGELAYAYQRMWRAVKDALAPSDVRLILDVWNGNKRERSEISRALRELGADRIVAWYFTTPVEKVEEWFWQKPGVARSSEMMSQRGKGLVFYSEGAPRRDHEFFHELASDIYSDGFDEVIEVNPVVVEPQHLLQA